MSKITSLKVSSEPGSTMLQPRTKTVVLFDRSAAASSVLRANQALDNGRFAERVRLRSGERASTGHRYHD